MNFEFKKASREAVGTLVGVAGSSGSGKTFSALRMATGLAAGKQFALIDSENGRAKHYADQYSFDHGDLSAPFTPERYTEAILAADKAGYPVIVVDSVSHIWSGDGGVLDMQEAELDRMAGDGDWRKREACRMASWIRPKMEHKKFVQKLLQVKAHLILCMRAEERIEMIKEDGKLKIVPKQSLTGLDGWIPVCEKSLPYELTLSFLLTADAPGVPKPIKLQQQHRPFFDLAKPITEEAGQKLAEWARGAPPKTIEELAKDGNEISKKGSAALSAWWLSLKGTGAHKKLADELPKFKILAEEADDVAKAAAAEA